MQTNREKPKTSFRSEREFGVLVGLVFTALGSWWLYHDKWKIVATGFLALGAVLLLLGAIYPKLLVFPNRAWMGLATLLSLVTTPIILGIVYFMILMPIGVVKRLFGWDPLRRRATTPSGSYWSSYNVRQHDPRHFEKMF
jgi:hypothetical protein